MILDFILNLSSIIIGVVLGCYILFVGRRAVHLTLAIIGFTVAANLLAVFVAEVDNSWELIGAHAWWMLALALGIGVLGYLWGRARPDTAVFAIGFAAGADLALWFYDISNHVVTNVYGQPREAALGIGLLVLLLGGLLGLWLIRVSRDEALILITMLIGTQMLQSALRLNRESSLTAIIILTLALAGILVQYTLYLREVKGEQKIVEPHASSVAYFQDLELHL